MRSNLRFFLDSRGAGEDACHFGGEILADPLRDYFGRRFSISVEI